MRNKDFSIQLPRRSFFKRLGQMAVGGFGANLALRMASMGELAAQTSGEDYKALVVLYLSGGNDAINTVVPTDAASYTRYQKIRGKQAVDKAKLLGITSKSGQPYQAGLHPSMTEMRSLYNAGRLGVVANIGTLVEPVTTETLQNGSARVPTNLFSHYDQTNTWFTLDQTLQVGWGGLLGDSLSSQNNNRLFTAISVNGYSVLLAGNSTSQFNTNTDGTAPVFFSDDPSDSVNQVLTGDRVNLLERGYSSVFRTLRDGGKALSTYSLADSALPKLPKTRNSSQYNSWLEQVQSIAKIIGGRQGLGVKRQVFLAKSGESHDTHDGQLDRQPNLLTNLSEALGYFDSAMAKLGLQNNVTLVTISEFGRTLTPNEDGTDHGWGGHQFVMGGAVNGGEVYGKLPIIDTEGKTPDFYGNNMTPTISVDQYVATLGKWFGLSDSQLLQICPHLSNFSVKDLGFMKA